MSSNPVGETPPIPSVAELSKAPVSFTAETESLFGGIRTMLAFATATGKAVPKETAQRLARLSGFERSLVSESALEETLAAHAQLSALVAPATARSIEATEPPKGLVEHFRRQPLVSNLLLAAVVAIVVFVATMRPAESDEWLAKQVFLLAAATLGAAFYSLFTAYRYIVARTFDPTYSTVYLVRFVLGIVSGLLLGHFGEDLLGGAQKQLTQPLLAMLGGYSAEAVNQVLERFADTLVTMVRGTNEETFKAKEKQLAAENRQAQVLERAKLGQELAGALELAVQQSAPPAVTDAIRKLMHERLKEN